MNQINTTQIEWVPKGNLLTLILDTHTSTLILFAGQFLKIVLA
jgi:hypothetical protein